MEFGCVGMLKPCALESGDGVLEIECVLGCEIEYSGCSWEGLGGRDIGVGMCFISFVSGLLELGGTKGWPGRF